MKANIVEPANEQTTRFLRKIHQIKAVILLYQSSLERKNLVKLKKTIYYVNKAFCCTECSYKVKTIGEVSV